MTFSLAQRERVTLKIYDVLGREIETIVNDEMEAGAHSLEWASGALASGMYFYRLATDNYVATKKMMVLR